MFRKNTPGQFIGFVAINSSTGQVMTGITGFAAHLVIDGSSQVSATGTVTDKGNGQFSFALSQADTNGNDISILFTMTNMIPVEKTFVTTAADPTNSQNFGLNSLPSSGTLLVASILASTGFDNIVIETGVNPRQALSAIFAAAAGVILGANTNSITIKGGNVSTTRIAADTDGSGNRTTVILTLPT